MENRDDIVKFRDMLRRMERITLSRVKDQSYCCGVTVNQGHILLCLDVDAGLSLTELNKELRLDKASLSRTVDILVKKGMVERNSHVSDRRKQILNLSSEGKEFVARLNRVSLESFGRIMNNLSESARERIIPVLEELAEALGREEDMKSNWCCPSGSREER